MIFSQFKAIYIENMKLTELKKIADQHIKELEEKLTKSITKPKNDKNNFVINNNDNVSYL